MPQLSEHFPKNDDGGSGLRYPMVNTQAVNKTKGEQLVCPGVSELLG